ncbi:hypothetical protein N8D56_23315 [Devosia sp. A8/3-2]|nr:hypothetical protein N8D56_23315 [Devosia sp. A8/3-2]
MVAISPARRQARQLDHGAEGEFHPIRAQQPRIGGDGMGPLAHPGDLAGSGDEGHHDFDSHWLALLFAGCPHASHDGLHLHLQDFGIGDGQPHAAMAQHGVDFGDPLEPQA